MASRATLALLAVAAVVSACGGRASPRDATTPRPSAGATATGTAPASATLDCAHAPVARPAGPGGSVVAGRVTFSGLRAAVTADFGHGTARRFRAPVGVRRGPPVTIAVAAGDRGWLALEYGAQRNDGGSLTLRDGRPVLRLAPCDDRAETVWAGGFLVTRPGCATLIAGGTRVRVGFGRRCGP
jgi:hypothetical protein